MEEDKGAVVMIWRDKSGKDGSYVNHFHHLWSKRIYIREYVHSILIMLPN